MDAIGQVFEKVVNQHDVFMSDTAAILDEMISNLSTQNPQLLADVSALAAKLTDCAKDEFTAIQRYSKVVEKKFKTDLDDIWDPKVFEGRDKDILMILIKHFIREGRYDLAQSISQESGVEFDQQLHLQFVEMFHIQKALSGNDYDSAIEWATKHTDFLSANNLNLEFNLHQLKYLQYIGIGDIKSSLAYAKSHFYKFSAKNLTGTQILKNIVIQKLMCSLLYIKNLAKSPYKSMFEPLKSAQIKQDFTRAYSMTTGESHDSLLYTSTKVGLIALPIIMKVSAMMKDKGLGWSQTNEMPVTIPLRDSQRFHSIFVCPVTKEQGRVDNPAMMILCGHVVCKESLARLAKGGGGKFKCPYCPIDSTAAQAIEVYF